MDYIYLVLLVTVVDLFFILSRRFILCSLALTSLLIYFSIRLYFDLIIGYYTSFGYSFSWFDCFNYYISILVMLDLHYSTICVVILGVCSVIMLFSVSYMFGDPRLYEFILLLLLFVSSMLMLLGSLSMFWFLSFWEGIGVCSFCLIGFWLARIHAIRASLQAMLVNKVGDLLLVIAIVSLLQFFCGDLIDIFVVQYDGLTWLMLLILFGACSKSALGLFHLWLPYAMEGPTSVSALIHAATLVTAGLFLLMKIKFILLSGYVCLLLLVLAFIGIVLLSLIGIDQQDVKRLIAYSTLSQMSYLAVTIAIGSCQIAGLYILVHALFKSLMFMTAGVVIHGIVDQQDMRSTSALGKTMPIALGLISISCLSMFGVVGTMGMYSKECIVTLLGSTYTASALGISICLQVLGLVATVLYSATLILRLFSGGATPWMLHRSSDELGLYTALLLLAQVVSLCITGSYLMNATSATGLLSTVDAAVDFTTAASYSADTSVYLYAGSILLLVMLLRSDYTLLVTCRLHAVKWYYDKLINTVTVLLHELSTAASSDTTRVVFLARYSLSYAAVVVSASYMRMIAALLVAAIILLLL